MIRYLTPQQDQVFLHLGRLLSEESFKREKKELYLADMKAKIDMIYRKNGELVVAEIKRSSKRLENGIKQLKFYLYLLHQKGITLEGMIKIPEERKQIPVILSDEDIEEITGELVIIDKVVHQNQSPEKIRLSICPKCAHFEFCWA